MTKVDFQQRYGAEYDLPMVNYTNKLEKNQQYSIGPLVPRYAGTRSRTQEEIEKHMKKKYTICILYNQKKRTYSQPLLHVEGLQLMFSSETKSRSLIKHLLRERWRNFSPLSQKGSSYPFTLCVCIARIRLEIHVNNK